MVAAHWGGPVAAHVILVGWVFGFLDRGSAMLEPSSLWCEIVGVDVSRHASRWEAPSTVSKQLVPLSWLCSMCND